MAITLEELQILITTSTAELQQELDRVRDELSDLDTDTNSATDSMKTAFKAVAAAIATLGIVKYVSDSIEAASQLESAMKGLKSIAEGQGRSFSGAKKFIDSYISDGLVPLTNAVTAYKNLVSRGYSDEQIKNTLERLKDAAAYGRQASYSLGDAVESATEGLKNENSILVDNAGVTKNVAKMWEDYAKSLGKTSENLSKQERIQAEVNGIMEETKFQVGDAAGYSETYAGKLAALNKSLMDIQVNIGRAFMPIVSIVLPYLQLLATALTRVTVIIAEFAQALFGKDQSKTDGTDKQAKAMLGLGNATTKAGKAAKGTLANFDQINALAKSSSSGAADTSTLDQIVEPNVVSDLSSVTEEISAKIQKMADKVKEALSPLGNYFKDLKTDFDNFYEDIKPSLEDLAKFIKENEIPVWEEFKVMMKELGDVAKIDASNGLVIVKGDIKVLSDLLKGDFKQAAKDAWQALKDIDWNRMKDYIQALINPVGTLMGKTLEHTLAWKGLRDALGWVKDKFNELPWQGVLDGIGWITNPFGKLFGNIATGKTDINDLKNAFLSLKNDALKPIGDFIEGAFDTAVGTVFKGISDAINGVKTSLNGVVTFINGVFSGDWRMAWEGLKGIVKGIFDTFHAVFNIPINLMIDAINGLIKGLNKISFDIPDWVANLAGIKGGKFGINIPTIPKLDVGTNYVAKSGLAYIHEGEAVVPKKYNPESGGGDNREVVSALNAILQAVRSGNAKELIVKIGNTELGRAAADGINEISRRTGRNPLQI